MAVERKARKTSGAAPVEKQKKTKKRFSLWKVLVLALAVFGICFFVKAELDIYAETAEYNRQLAGLQQAEKEVALSIAEKEELRQGLLNGDANDETIIRIIRSRGYVYPDEVIYYDVEKGE